MKASIFDAFSAYQPDMAIDNASGAPITLPDIIVTKSHDIVSSSSSLSTLIDFVSYPKEISVWSELELLNTEGSEKTFVTSNSYKHGLHYFTLQHLFLFKGVKISLITTKGEESPKNSLTTLENEKNELYILLDMQSKKLSVSTSNKNILFEFSFIGSQCRILITLKGMGNFVSVNPYYLPLEKNIFFKFINAYNNKLIIKKCAEWSFILNFSLEHYSETLDEFLKNELKEVEGHKVTADDCIYDKELKILALKRCGYTHQALQATNKIALVPAKKALTYALTPVTKVTNEYAFYVKYKLDILSHKGQTSSQDIREAVTNLLLALKNLKTSSKRLTNSFILKYVSSIDALIIFDRGNKFKVIYERDAQQEFVISPYLFERHKITAYFGAEELINFFKHISWDSVGLLSTPYEKLLILNALKCMKESLIKIADHVFLVCPESLVENFVRCIIRTFDTFVDQNIEDSKYTTSLTSQEEDLTILFEETPEELNKNGFKKFRDKQNFDLNSPSENDIAKNVLLRLEEALYQQSTTYSKLLNFSSRAHTSYARLSSFGSLHAEYNIMRHWLDLGCYFKSQTREMCTFYNNNTVFFQGSVLNESPTDEQLLLNKAIVKRECVPLNFSLSHQRPYISNSEILHLELLDKDLIIGVLESPLLFKLFCLGFGLAELYRVDLSSPSLAMGRSICFKSLLHSPKLHTDYFNPQSHLNCETTDTSRLENVKIETYDVEKGKFERLCKLGFNAELCKTALLEIGEEIPDEGVSVILSYMNQPSASEVFYGASKSLPIASNSEVQLSSFPQKASVEGSYFEKKTFADKEGGNTSSQEPSNLTHAAGSSLPNIKSVVKLGGFFSAKKGQLPALFLLFFFNDDHHPNNLLFLRLEYSDLFLRKFLIIDRNGECPSSTWPGRALLQRGAEEATTAHLFSDLFFLQIHAILPRKYAKDMFFVSGVQVAKLPVDLAPQKLIFIKEDDDSRKTAVILFNSKFLGKAYLIQAETSSDQIFEVKIGERIDFGEPQSLVCCRKELFIYDNVTLRKVCAKQLVLEDILKSSERKICAVAPLPSGHMLVTYSDACEILSSDPIIKGPNLKVLPPPLAEKTKVLTPQLLLSSLHKNKNCPLSIISHKNLIPERKVSSSAHFLLHITDSGANSEISFNIAAAAKTLTVYIKLFVKIPAEINYSLEFREEFALLAEKIRTFASTVSLSLPLVSLTSNATGFFENMPLPNVLFADDEPFTHPNCHGAFIFENSLKKYMKIQRINFRLAETNFTNETAIDVLFFIFSDFYLLSELQSYCKLTLSEYIELWKNNKIADSLKPVAYADLNRLGCFSFSVEFSKPPLGHYVAFMALSRTNTPSGVLSVNFFSVEGTYVDQKHETLLEMPNSFATVPENLLSFIPAVFLNNKNIAHDLGIYTTLNESLENVIVFAASIPIVLENSELCVYIPPSSSASPIYAAELSVTYFNSDEASLYHTMLKGNTDEITKIVLSFYEEIKCNPECDEDYIGDFIKLLQYLQSFYLPMIMEILAAKIDWDEIVLKRVKGFHNIFNTLLFEVINKASKDNVLCHLNSPALQQLKGEEISNLPMESQKIIWLLARNSTLKNELKPAVHQLFRDVFMYISKQIEKFYTFEEKALQLMGLEVIEIRKPFPLTPFSSSEQSFMAEFPLLRPAARSFCLIESTYHDYYIVFEKKAQIHSVSLSHSATTGIEPFTLNFFVHDPHSGFALVWNKLFDANFCFHLTKSALNKNALTVMLDLPQTPFDSYLVRVQISFNHLCSFRYSQRTAIQPFKLNFYGETGDEPLPEVLSGFISAIRTVCEEKIVKKAKICEIPISHEKTLQFTSTVACETTSISSPSQNFEKWSDVCFLLSRNLTALEPTDLTPKAPAVAAIKVLNDQRACLLKSLTNQDPQRVPESQLLHTWIARMAEFIIAAFNGTHGSGFISSLSTPERIEIASYLIYYFPLFEGVWAGGVKAFRAQLVQNIPPTDLSSLLERLMNTFLGEKDIIFIAALQRFSYLLLNAGVMTLEWQTQAEYIANNLIWADSEEGWKRFLIRLSLLVHTLEASPSERLKPLGITDCIQLLLFIAHNNLQSVIPKMTLLLAKLTESFAAAQFLGESNLHNLREVILAAEKVGYLHHLKGFFEEQITELRLSIRQTTSKAITSKITVAYSLASYLGVMLRDFVILPGAEGRFHLIEFSLSILVDLANILCGHLGEKNPTIQGRTLAFFTSSFLTEFIGFCEKPGINSDVLLCKLFNLFAHEEVGGPLLAAILDLYKEASEGRQKRLSDCIIEKVAKIFGGNKNKALLQYHATTIIEFVVKILSVKSFNLQAYSQTIEFCSQISLYPINIAGSLVYSETPCAVEFKGNVFLSLFSLTLKLVYDELNFGGADNFLFLEPNIVSLIEMCTHLTFILHKGLNIDRKPLFEEFFLQFSDSMHAEEQSKARDALRHLIGWLMLNFNIAVAEQPTPTGSLLKQLFSNCLRLFRLFFSHTFLGLEAVDAICFHLRAIYTALSRKATRDEQPGYMFLLLADNVSEFLASLIEELVSNRSLLLRFLGPNRGLEFIFELLARWLEPPSFHDATEGIVLRIHKFTLDKKMAEKQSTGIPVANIRDKAAFEIELANRLQIFFEDKGFISPLICDWQVNKKGVDKALYSMVFPFNKKHLRLRLQLPTPAYVRNIKLGFYLQRWDKQLTLAQPAYVRLNLIVDEKSQRLPLGELQRVEDAGYASCLSTVYVLNINRLQGDYATAISRLVDHIPFMDLEVVIGKPVVTVVDKISPIYSRCTGPSNLAISFISLEGFPVSKVDIKRGFQQTLRKTFSKAIEFLFDNETSMDVLEEFFHSLPPTERQTLFRLIEGQLEGFVEHFTLKLSKFFLVIAAQEETLARSLFYILLRYLSSNDHFFVLIEALIRPSYNPELLLAFFTHCVEKVTQGVDIKGSYLEVISNCLIEFCAQLDSKTSMAFPLRTETYAKLLDLFANRPHDTSYLRILALLPCLFEEKALYAPLSILTPDKYFIERDSNTCSQEISVILRETIYHRLAKGEQHLLPLLATISSRSLSESRHIEEERVLESTVTLACELNNDSIYAHSAIQIFSKVPMYLLKLNKLWVHTKLCEAIEAHLATADWHINSALTSSLLRTLFSVCFFDTNTLNVIEEHLFSIFRRQDLNKLLIEHLLQPLFSQEFTKSVQFRFIINSTPKKTEEKIEIKAPASLFEMDSNYLNETQKGELERIGQTLISPNIQQILAKHKWKKVSEGSFIDEDYSAALCNLLVTNGPILLVANCMKETDNTSIPFVLFSPAGFKSKTPDLFYTESTTSSFFCVIDNNETAIFRASPQKDVRCFEINDKNKQLKVIYAYHQNKKAVIFPLEKGMCQHNEWHMLWAEDCAWSKHRYQDDISFKSFELYIMEAQQIFSGNLRASSFYYEKMNQPIVVDNLGSSISSIHSALPIFILPAALTPRAIQTSLKTHLQNERMDTALGDFSENLITLDCVHPIFSIEKRQLEGNYTPVRPLFKIFAQKGGISFLLNALLSESTEEVFLLTKSAAIKLRKALLEILRMEKFPDLFLTLASNNEFYTLLFALLTKTAPVSHDWPQVAMSLKAFLVDTLKGLLEKGDEKAWAYASELNVLGIALEFLSELSTEPRRRKVTMPIIEAGHSDTLRTEPSTDRDPMKRKGVGYDKENSGQSWIISDYLTKLKRKNNKIVSIISLIGLILQRKDAALYVEELCESCLLPLLENSFKNTSLQDIAKEAELYISLYQLVLIMARHPDLRSLLGPLSTEYVPRQLHSINETLALQRDSLLTFKSFAVRGPNEKMPLMDLADEVIRLSNEISSCVGTEDPDLIGRSKALSNMQKEDLDVNSRYKLSLEKLRFGLSDMKKEGKYLHIYADSLEGGSPSSSSSRSLRLAQEVTMLATSLPADSFNAIFVRCDAARLDLLKSLISGAEGTPYAHGLFEYHLLLPPGYPFVPPKCTFQTTGGGDVRFNPNLYNCGKVCLSLLGTWRGHASENWDAKISNVLQLLLSLQSIVMSEEVYFNEPGFEHEVGTEGGESKNEAYSNIVRLCNIKYAMIGQIRTPPPGFEHVVRRHFYIKSEVILRECAEWVKRSTTSKANYTDLVVDHNHNYALRFSSDPSAYTKELTEEISTLEQTLKELRLDSDPRDIYSPVDALEARSKRHQQLAPTEQPRPFTDNEADVGYDTEVVEELFDVNASKVTDRWSRYIGVMGFEAIRKQSNTSVLIVGLNAIGLETAKSLTLSGFHRIVLADWQTLTAADLPSVFYAEQTQIGMNRAAAVLSKLRQLNPFVRIEANNLAQAETWGFINSVDIIVLCHHFPPITDSLLIAARMKGKKIVLAEAYGVFGRIFCDFGDEFIVTDPDGEEPAEVYFESVDYEKNSLLLAPNSHHSLKEGDRVQLITDDSSSSGLMEIRITLKEPLTQLEVGVEQCLRTIEIPSRRGKLREIKSGYKLHFQAFSNDTDNAVDEYINPCDFTKPNSAQETSECFRFKQTYEENYATPFSVPHETNFEEHAANFPPTDKNTLLQSFIILSRGCAPSVAAFIGGMAAQEVIKAATAKYRPIAQSFYYDCRELLSLSFTPLDWKAFYLKHKEIYEAAGESSDKYLEALLGHDLLARLQNASAFVIGAGAIGCELLKNLAQWGVGSGSGRLTVADPDSIELSNLSRQFLFREKHISKLKAVVAARAVEALHPRYAALHIEALPLRVGPQSEDVFSDAFFSSQALCLNALDNVPARIYVDQRCVRNRVPLLESGTLGPKGHVQVIVPFVTENYSAVRDPQEETSIPLCTMKMFPEDINHCIEWAKDKMDDFFFQKPRTLRRVVEEWRRGELATLEPKLLRQSLRFLRRRPKDCTGCMVEARRLFQKYFFNNVAQLLDVYPPHARGKEGRLFWELPRRRPSPLPFNATEQSHINAVKSTALLLARIWGIDAAEFDQLDVALIAGQAVVKPFASKSSAAQAMRRMLQKETGETPEDEAEDEPRASKEELIKEWIQVLSQTDNEALEKCIHEEIFEKDNDANGHVHFLASFTNLRAANYSLPPTDWLTVKIRAGRITPALPTTTSIVASLQTLEAVKVLMTGPIELYRNSFLNVAVPMMAMAEPGPPLRHKPTPHLEVTVWDLWSYTFTAERGDKLEDLFTWVQDTYNLSPTALMHEATSIFMHTLHSWDEFKGKKLSHLLGLAPGAAVDTALVCSLPGDAAPVPHLPPLTIAFREE